MPEHDPTEIVREALREAIVNAEGQSALAAAIGEGVKTGHIFYWLKVGAVPEKHVVVIEEFTGVSRKRLCPGWRRMWPELMNPEEAAAEAALFDRRRSDRRAPVDQAAGQGA